MSIPVRSHFLLSVGSVSGKGDASDEDDDNEFFDAMEDPAEFITVPADPKYHRLISVLSVLFFFFRYIQFFSYIPTLSTNLFLIVSPFFLQGDLAVMLVGSAVKLEWTISR